MPLAPSLRLIRAVIAAGLCCAIGTVAFAGTGAGKKNYHMPAGDAAMTLAKFARNSGLQIVFLVENVRGEKTRPVHGDFTPMEAVRLMLEGTALVAMQDGATGAIAVSRRRADGQDVAAVPPDEWERPGKKKNGPARGTGTVEGRVINADTAQYLAGARVAVGGTFIDDFTDVSGRYRLVRVPAGVVRVHVYYTGSQPVFKTITVVAGETVRGDFDLADSGSQNEAVELDPLVVSARKDRDAAAVAINEQRFSPNIKNVVSTDEFGGDAEGNIGEFLKFIPGISLEFIGGNARSVSLAGTPSPYVPVTVNGLSLASPGGDSGTNRSVSLDFMAMNNLSRIEVEYAPTPESQGGALGGSVNMIPRNAFERARPLLSVSTYVTMRDDAKELHRTPGPLLGTQRKIHPGMDFSYVVPVSKAFGFTLSASSMTQYAEEDQITNGWRGVNQTTGANFPATTVDRPYLTNVRVGDSGKNTDRDSLGMTVDLRLGRNDAVSFGYQLATTRISHNSRFLSYNITRVNPGDFATTFTHGAAGQGNITVNAMGRQRDVRTSMPSITWRHNGPVWKMEAGLGISKSTNLFRDVGVGRYYNVLARRNNVTVSFDGFAEDAVRPAVITVTDGTTGLPVDPTVLGSYAMSTVQSAESYIVDKKNTAYLNVRRDFYGAIPLSIKAGLDARESIRDTQGGGYTYNFLGPDGKISTTPEGGDDGAAPYADISSASNAVNYGFPSFEAPNSWALYQETVAHPAYFDFQIPGGAGSYTSGINGSKYARELVSAAFLRLDGSFLGGRLKLIGGLRAEQTNIDALGPLSDPAGNFQKSADGSVILDSEGNPLLLYPAGTIEALKLTFLERAARSEKEYLRLFPSLNLNCNLSDRLVLRAACYSSVGRPNYNQYAGGLSLPDTESPPSANNRFTLRNVGIKAWSAQSTTVRLEYYFSGVGQIAVAAFRRDYDNFFGNTVARVTPELLRLYGLDPALYGAYEVSTQYNLPGIVRGEGWSVDYKQQLVFLPHWARGVQVFANASFQTIRGEVALRGNFGSYVPRVANWGFSLTRPKFNLKMNWNDRSRMTNNQVPAGAGIDPEAYSYSPPRRTCDIIAEYKMWKNVAVFANLRNVTDAPITEEIYAPATPPQARLRDTLRYGSLWTFGLRGTF